MNRQLKLLLKLVFVAGLLYFLGKKGFISVDKTREAFTHFDLIGMAYGATFIALILGFIRWQWLLRPQGIHLSWSRVLQLSLIGNFFNVALPGAVSGDFVKAFYVGHEVPGLRARAFGSILFDRVAGLSALVLVSATALLLDYSELQGTPLMAGIRVMVVGAAVGVLFFYSYLFLVREHHDPLLALFRALEKKSEKLGTVTRIYIGIRHYHNHRWAVLRALAISLVIHVLICTAAVCFARALGDVNIPVLPVFVIVPLGLLVTSVPVLPGGIGTGHAAFGWLFHYLGSQRGADIFSLYVLGQLAYGAIGGLVYLRFRAHEPKPTLGEATA
jgi:uncharacterized protein (TIRG00374 family)